MTMLGATHLLPYSAECAHSMLLLVYSMGFGPCEARHKLPSSALQPRACVLLCRVLCKTLMLIADIKVRT